MLVLILLAGFFIQASCKKSGSTPDPTPPPTPAPTSFADYWLTKGNQSALMQQQTKLGFGTVANNFPFIDVDSTQAYQTMEGFGYTLTGGSAVVINQLTPTAKTALLNELFTTAGNGIGISYLRISIGASDLNATVFTYDDMPAGQTDLNLDHFSLDPDKTDLIPLLKQIIAIQPGIKIIATPWSPPAWMKDNGSSIGGSLKPEYYDVYAKYFVKYIQQMKAEGITIDLVTPQNEPENPANNPSLSMTAAQQATFIKENLGPAFQAAAPGTRIVIYDHNCDHPDYPLSILNDAAARPFIDGSAFHLYAGDITALSTLHNAYPDKNVYFTEQYTGSTGDFGGDFTWHLKNVLIGATRNWSKIVMEWNLANDASFGPHTPGGCNTCKGALTINTGVITRNVAYYIVAHASKFVPAGSLRIASNNSGSLYSVAFKTPEGKKVLIVENDGATGQSFNIRFKGEWVTSTLDAGAVATYVW